MVRLRPAPHSRTRILSYSMRVEPAEHFINWQQDAQANYLARLVFHEKTDRFRVEVDLVVEMAVLNPFDFYLEPYATEFPFSYAPELEPELAPYRGTLPLTPHLKAYLEKIPRVPTPTADFLVAVNQRLQQDITYLIRMEPGVQDPEYTLECASGSCRDSAWLLVQLLRHLGLAARFVSGYLIQLAPDVRALDGPSGPTTDFTDLHAWCEVYLPGAGWLGLDATSGLLAGEGHIPLACSAEPGSAAPVTGAVEPCEVEFGHSMSVQRIWEAPRVTKPYTPEQWAAIAQLGHRLDAKLAQQDVRLTQGGEPTFVSLDDRDGPQWNVDAMGPGKRDLAAILLGRLYSRYAPGGMLHFGQGKWYPGEQLPRWSLNAFWRTDGKPLWHDPALFGDEAADYGATEAHAKSFLEAVAQRLGVDTAYVFPAYEDILYYLWRERRLPANVDPFDSRLDDALERERLRRVFTQGLDKVAGHVLPVARSDRRPGRWQSSRWFLREEHCYLVPGDSPLGYRLPLDSLPWVREQEYPWVHPADPNQAVAELPAYVPFRPTSEVHSDQGAQSMNLPSDPYDGPSPGERALDEVAPGKHESARHVARTAICAEARAGRLYVFLPPTRTLEDYLELVSAVEGSAQALGLPVILEGEEPPRDPRVVRLRVTPDPGVIEVNVHPSASWEALVEQTEFLYEAAQQCRLSTEKFQRDGRHTGTGGGNHVVLGGATPADSPFLRRPDLLGSLVAYWNDHPSLSYLFFGMFIGPTSQAPRADEGRDEAIYELEIALREMRRLRKEGRLGEQPWQVDRMLRNLLIDVTGNTHRAEFCIDKLYSPDSSTGRLGLLELRGFEMPPHAHMSLTQQLLLRALVSRFWDQPYERPRLKRWGTELHDRFMLPHFVWDDFGDVIEELRMSGHELELAWFRPHFEFRFASIGDFAARNVHVELRTALEPWNVLGEESRSSGTARYVDSSVERLQVKVSGLIGDRHVLTCNGRAVPLQPTGNLGEFVAGVRYRAWWPSSSLHPTIGIHAPLVFDLVDTWMNRSCGGCRYHVEHPGGRNVETVPVNAYEAEARRSGRFFRMGHTPGPISVREEPRNPNFPFTLDLRR